MDAAAIRSCIVATLDADADVRRRAELQLKQVCSRESRGRVTMDLNLSNSGRC
jgi:hypothetical protein